MSQNDMGELKPPGLPCPECGYHISVTLQMLLSNGTVFCANCGLRLEVDEHASSQSLAVLEDLDQGFKEARKMKENALNFNSM